MYPILNRDNYIKIQPNQYTLSLYKNHDRRMVGLNESAKDILELCNGENTINDIILTLSKKYHEEKEKVTEFVHEFIDFMKNSETLTMIPNKTSRVNTIKGSKEFYTPDFVILELTHNCPLRCKHCYLNAGVGKSISSEALDEICLTLTNLGVECVQLTGGEPFLHKDILKIIKFFTSQKIKVQITTSGMVQSKEILETINLIKAVNGLVQVSLDGLEETHNGIRKDNKSYSRAINFIKELINNGVTVVVATCIIDQDLVEIEKLSGKLKELGVKMHRIGSFSEQGRAENNNLIPVHATNIIENFIDYLKSKYSSPSYTISGFEDFEENNLGNCGAGYKILKIDPDLKVYPCPMMNLEIGDLNKESIYSIMTRNSEIFPYINKPSTITCGDCEQLNKCKNCMSEGTLNRNKVSKCRWFENEKKLRKLVQKEVVMK